jgi:uncharacterized membrane protein YtjA (UPF0391 family)
MPSPPTIAIVALTIPFIVSLLAAWAWGWRGIAASAAGGAALTFLIYLSQVIMFAKGARLPLTVALIFVTWLAGSVPSSIIGLAIRSIVAPAAQYRSGRFKIGHC